MLESEIIHGMVFLSVASFLFMLASLFAFDGMACVFFVSVFSLLMVLPMVFLFICDRV